MEKYGTCGNDIVGFGSEGELYIVGRIGRYREDELILAVSCYRSCTEK
jgi:hypothetical protein